MAGTWEFDLTTMTSVPSSSINKVIKAEETSRKQESEIFSYLDEEGRLLARKLMQNAIETCEGFDVTLPVTTPKGTKLWLRNIVEVETKNEKAVKLKVVSVDVTEQQNLIVSQERIKSQLEKQLKIIDAISKIREDFISSGNNNLIYNNTLEELLHISGSEYGLIADVLYDQNNQPFLKTQAVLSLLWNNEQKEFYTKNKISGSDFQSLNPTFFSKLRYDRITVANNLSTNKNSVKKLTGEFSPLDRIMSFPVIYGNNRNTISIVMIVNKQNYYTQDDVEYLTPFISSYASIIKALKIEEEKRQAEEALKNEQERLAGVLEGANIGTIEWNIQTGAFVFNRKWAEMLGYTLEELGEMNVIKWLKMLHPEDKSITLKKAANIRRNNAAKVSGVFRIKHKEGYWVWMHGEGKTLKYSADNKPLIMYGINTNITHEYEAKQFLLQTLDDLHETQQLAKIGRWELDLENNILYWDQTVYDIFEIDSSKIKPTYEGFLEKVFPDDAATVNNRYLNSIKNKTPYEITHRLKMDDGRIKWVIEKCHNEYNDQGNAIRSIGLIQDITELKATEEIVKKQAENAILIGDVAAELIKISKQNSSSIINDILKKITEYFDVDRGNISRIVYAENNVISEYSYHKAHILSVPNIFPLSTVEVSLNILQKDGYVIIPNNKLITKESELFKALSKDGIKSLISAPLFNEKGEMSGSITFSSFTKERNWTSDDVALMKIISTIISDSIIKIELENNLIVAKQKSEEANKAKSEFLANISHEIRTPLNAVLGYSELLKEKIKDPKLESYIKGITTGGENLLSLINNILDLSKIESGVITFEKKPVSIKKILNELKQVFGISCKQKNISCSITYTPSDKGRVVIDELRLKQVLYNIIGNAIKFTDKNGSISVDVEYRALNEKASFYDLIFKIQDTGIGIPEDQQERIFEAFVQQDGQNSRKYGGTGLGLAITKKLVTLMGGKILLNSEPGKGSFFTIIIPNVKVVKSDKITNENNTSNKNILFKNQTILLVEDVLSNREIIKEYFATINLKLVEAVNGIKALNYLKKNKPDLILMDIMMPEMDGYTTAAEIRKNKKLSGIPIISLTAKPLGEDDETKQKYFDGYFQKPISKNDLIQILKKYLSYENKKSGLKSVKNKINNRPIELDKKVIDEVLKMYKKTEHLMSIDDIKHFSVNLSKKAKNIKNKELSKIASELTNYCNEYEIKKMNMLMKKIPGLLNTFKQSK